MNTQLLFNRICSGIIVLIVCVLTFKFFMWNYWKLEQAGKQVKAILNAPPAVNLVLWKENTLLFRKSFAANPDGNFYIINRFDITPFIADTVTLNPVVNKDNTGPLRLYRFKRFNIIALRDYYFVFIIQTCEMEEFVTLKDSMLPTIKSLSTLTDNSKNVIGEGMIGEFIEVKMLKD